MTTQRTTWGNSDVARAAAVRQSSGMAASTPAPRTSLLVALACAGLGLASCKSDDDAAADGGTQSGPTTDTAANTATNLDAADALDNVDGDDPLDAENFIDCSNDVRADHYMPGMSKPGRVGKLNFALVVSDPAPPKKGFNTWTLAISDAASKAELNAKVHVTPYMPDHGHGPPVPAKVGPGAVDGRYAISNLYLFMPGLWQVTFDVTTAAGDSDSAVFSFCIGK